MSSGVVVGGVLLTIDKLLRMIQLAICTTSSLVNNCRFQVDEDCSGDVFAASSFREEGLEGVISEGFVRGHVAVRLDAMFQAVKLPTGVSNLATCLADVDGDALTLGKEKSYVWRYLVVVVMFIVVILVLMVMKVLEVEVLEGKCKSKEEDE